jgi:hypothetical protein
MALKTFLSIDMDYWNLNSRYSQKNTDAIDDGVKKIYIQYNGVRTEYYAFIAMYLADLVRGARQRRIPVTAVDNHQQMLPFVDKSKARRLVNVDTHSDLASKDVEIFSCGSWISYVKWRNKGVYEWWSQEDAMEGDCSIPNDGRPIWSVGRRARLARVDWSDIIYKRMYGALKPVHEMLDDVVHLSICESPGYSDVRLLPIFQNLVRLEGIRHFKGSVYDDDAQLEGVKPPKVKPPAR